MKGNYYDHFINFQESFGVIGDSTTAMRDPVFYRWHAHIDDIFQEFKATIPSYPVDQVRRLYLFFTIY